MKKDSNNQVSNEINVPIKMEIIDIVVKDKNGNIIKGDLNE